jgi:hypothetical protein
VFRWTPYSFARSVVRAPLVYAATMCSASPQPRRADALRSQGCSGLASVGRASRASLTNLARWFELIPVRTTRQTTFEPWSWERTRYLTVPRPFTLQAPGPVDVDGRGCADRRRCRSGLERLAHKCCRDPGRERPPPARPVGDDGARLSSEPGNRPANAESNPPGRLGVLVPSVLPATAGPRQALASRRVREGRTRDRPLDQFRADGVAGDTAPARSSRESAER